MANKSYKHFSFKVHRTDEDHLPAWRREYPRGYFALGEIDANILREKLVKEVAELGNRELVESCSENSNPYYMYNSSSPYSPRCQTPIGLGSSHNSRGESTGSYYTCKEYLSDARVVVNERLIEEGKRQKDYYSQQWV